MVSAIVTVYNGEKYVGEAIQSVLSQTYTPIEVVVIDDGSQDDSLAIIAKFGSRVKCHSYPNQGSGQARNEGVKHASGELLAFLDQDDQWEPNKTVLQVERLVAESPPDLLFGLVDEFYRHEAGDSRLRAPAHQARGLIPSALMLRRHTFDRVGPFGREWRVGEWMDWFVRARDEGCRIEVLESTVTRRALHENNLTLTETSSLVEYGVALKRSLDRRRARA